MHSFTNIHSLSQFICGRWRDFSLKDRIWNGYIYMGLIVLLVVLKQLQGAMHGLVLCTWLDMVCIEPRLVHECTKLFTNTCGWFCFFFYRYGFWEAPGMTQTHQCRKKKKNIHTITLDFTPSNLWYSSYFIPAESRGWESWGCRYF